MTTIERDNRTGHRGGFLWKKPLDDRQSARMQGRNLILEPTASVNPVRGAELDFWVEDARPRYYWYVETDTARPPARPSGPPHFSIETVERPNTRRSLRPSHPAEQILLSALARGDLHGESALSAVYSLFWQYFVENDGGLHYLCRYADREQGNYHARLRLLRFIDGGDHHRRENAQAAHAVEAAMKDHDEALGERFAMAHVCRDRNIAHAIEAIERTSDPEEVQHRQIRRLVELNATRMDHVITRIVEATRFRQALLGLRACQRVEKDPEFFAACDAYILANGGKGLSKFLRPQCPTPKLTWPYGNNAETDADVDVDDEVFEEADDAT